MFEINHYNEVTFEDCVIVDVRSRYKSFAKLNAGSVSFVRTEVRNIDVTSAFILAEGTTFVRAMFIDSYVTGLNRDHPYLLGQFDSRLLFANSTAIELIITRSVFEDNFSLESGAMNTADSLFISAQVLRLEISDSVFRRCTGGMLIHSINTGMDTVVNTVFEESHSEKVPLITLTSDVMTTFLFKEVKWTRNTCGTTMFKFALSQGTLRIEDCAYRENQLLGSSSTFLAFYSIASLSVNGLLFTDSGQMKQRQRWLWTDQLAPLGIFDQYQIDFAESNYCGALISFFSTVMPEVANVTITGRQETACNNLFLGENLIAKALGSTGSFQYLSTAVPLSTVFNLYWDEFPFSGYFSISDSEFAGAGRFISFSSTVQSSVRLTVANTVFRDSQNSEASGIPIQYSGPAATFANCSFVNCLSEMAALRVDVPEQCAVVVVVKDCEFRNNTSSSSSADLLVSGGGVANVTISNCSFFDSKGPGLGGSISLQSVFISSALIANCTFAGATTGLRGIVHLAHTAGTVVLNSVHFQSIFSPESILLLVDTNNFHARTELFNSSISNCVFLAGIKLSPGARLETRSNFAFGNSGTLVRNTRGVFIDRGSVYSGNKAKQGCLRFDSSAQMEITDSVFAENIVSGNIGVLYVKGPDSSMRLHNCTFLDNASTSSAGVILISGNCSVSVAHCRFERNSAQGASVLKMDQNRSPATIETAQLLGNTAMVQLIDSSLTMTDVAIASEDFAGDAGGIVLIRSEMHLTQSSMQDITGNRGCLATGISGSMLVLQAITVRRVSCYKEVAALSHNSTLQIINATIDATSSSQLAVISIGAGNLVMRNVTITAAAAVRAVVQITQTNATFSSVKYFDSEVPMVLVEDGGDVLMDYCEFANIHAEVGTAGAVECSGCDSVELFSSAFHHISASSVAGVSATARKVSIRKCTFQHLNSTDYGALYLSANEVNLSDSLFGFNAASNTSSSGGGVTISALTSEISHCEFFNNSANIGGAVRWSGQSPQFTDNTFRGNQAEYGPDIASYAASLQVFSDPLPELASGQTYKGQLVLHILDHAGQVIRNDNTSRAVMSSDALIGSVQSSALMGVLIFTEFAMIKAPGASVNATVALSGTSLNSTLVLKLRECVAGEVLREDKCVVCPLDTYSFDVSSGKCSICVDHAECHNGQIHPHAGYWRAGNFSDEVLQCPLQRACLGAVNGSVTGLCSELYTGNLCQSCTGRATRRGRDRCEQCLSDSIEPMRMALVVLAFMVFVCTLSVLVQGSHVGVALKGLLNYAHLTMLVAQFELDWPDALRDFFRLHDYLGNAIEQVLSFDCMSEALLKKVIAAAVLPICLILIFAVIWGVANVFCKCTRERLLSFWTVSLCYCYPFVVRTSLSLFSCMSIRPGEQWVRLELSIRCWDRTHSYYAFAAALPTLILWGVGVPALACLYLFRHRTLVSTRSIAFLYCGFRRRYLHWEILTFIRKICIIALYVFLSDAALALQGLFLCALLWLAAVLQSHFSAFESSVFNDIELRGIYVGLFTTLCGLCLGVETSLLAEYILLTLIIVAHCYFLTLWTIVFAAKTCPKFVEKVAFINKQPPIETPQINTTFMVFTLPPQMKSRYLHKLALQQLRFSHKLS